MWCYFETYEENSAEKEKLFVKPLNENKINNGLIHKISDRVDKKFLSEEGKEIIYIRIGEMEQLWNKQRQAHRHSILVHSLINLNSLIFFMYFFFVVIYTALMKILVLIKSQKGFLLL